MVETYIKAPWWFPPSNAEWFDLVGDKSVSSTTGLVKLVHFKLPVSSRGIVRWFGQDITNDTKLPDITWRILVNGGPDKVYGTIVGRLSTLVNLSRCLIRIPKGGSISFKVSSSSATAVNCFGRLQGWYWEKLD